MNDTAARALDDGVAQAVAGVASRARPPAPGPAAAPKPAREIESLDDAFGDLPARFLRAAREAARLSNSVEEWEAVERAHDAIVSERQAA